MTEEQLLERITADPAIFGGKPIIRGMRIAVEHVLGMLAAGDTQDRLLQEYPSLRPLTFRPAWHMRIAVWPVIKSRSGSSPLVTHEILAGCVRFIAVAP